MNFFGIKIKLIILVIIGVIAGGFLVSAQTWEKAGSPAPDNGRLTPLVKGGGDGMGDENPHTTNGGNLKMTYIHSDAPGGPVSYSYRIFNIGTIGPGICAGDPVVCINATGFPDYYGAANFTESSFGCSTGASCLVGKSSSANNSEAGIYAVNNGAGYALSSQSATHIAAKISDRLTVVNGLQIGSLVNQANNLLSLNKTIGSANDPLYWGNEIFCDQSLKYCGWLASGTGDGLGNHLATTSLDLSGFSLLNISSSDTNPGLSAGGIMATSTVAGFSENSVGIYTVSNGVDINASAGLYAYGGNHPGLGASSAQGLAARSIGSVELLPDVRGNAGLLIGSDMENLLSLDGGDQPTTNLYWGNSLLCDVTKDNCGWPTSSVAVDWPTNPFGIDVGSGKVLISRAASLARLDVGHGYSSQEKVSEYQLKDFVTTGAAYDAAVYGGYLYAVGAGGKLAVYDISNPQSTASIGLVTLGANSRGWGVETDGTYAYVATTKGLEIFDIHNPAQPVSVSSIGYTTSLSQPYPTDLVLYGHYLYLYVITPYSPVVVDLYAIDISNPRNPQVLNTLDNLLDNPHQLIIGGDKLIVADDDSGVRTFSLANPALPVAYARWIPGSPIYNLAAAGNVLYTAGQSLCALKLSDLSGYSCASQQFGDYSRGLAAVDGYVYVSAGSKGVQIYNTDNLSSLQWINNYVNPYSYISQAERLTASGGLLFVAGGTDNVIRVAANQGADISALETDSLTAQILSIGSQMNIQTSLTSGSLQVGLGGLKIDGKLTTGNIGLQLLDTTLSETDLIKLRTKSGL